MPENKSFDVIIVGGGVIGSATAYYLSRMDETIRLAVVEMDPSYTHASTPLSVANVRIQFNLKENIQISQYAFEALERFEEEMAVNGEKPKIVVDDFDSSMTFECLPVKGLLDRARAFLKIQDGCQSHCSYCIVPRARGPLRSLEPEKVLSGLKSLSRY